VQDEEDYATMISNLRIIANTMKELPEETDKEELEDQTTDDEIPEEIDTSEPPNSSMDDTEPNTSSLEIEVRAKSVIPGKRGALITDQRQMEVITPANYSAKNKISKESENKGEENKEVEGLDKFMLGGETIKLPNVSDNDSLSYRIESLRLYLEKELGDEIFIKAYKLLKNIQEEDDDDELSKQLVLILGSKLNYVSLIHQLIYCEEIHFHH
jgi:NIMA (never in mitosis gene a)-related kinase